MKLRNIALAAALGIGLANTTGAALAQSKVFYVNEAKVRQDAKVGKEMNAMLNTIANQGVQQLGIAELDKKISEESKALAPQLQSLSEDAIASNATLKARVEAFGQKRSELEQKSSQVNAAVNRTSNQLNTMFTFVLDPAIEHVAKQVGADVVLSDPNTRYIKESLDLTSRVVARLDASIPTVAALQAAMPQPAAAPKPAGQ